MLSYDQNYLLEKAVNLEAEISFYQAVAVAFLLKDWKSSSH